MEEEEVPTPVDEDEPTLEELDVFTMPGRKGRSRRGPDDNVRTTRINLFRFLWIF